MHKPKLLVLLPPFESAWLLSLPYDKYLQTSHWQRTRFAELQIKGHCCERCGSGDRLDVHHRTYEHLAWEELYPGDLEVLCRPCHAKEHGKVSL